MTGSHEISRHEALRGPTTAAALGRGSIITGRRRPSATTMRIVLDSAAALVAERGVAAVTPATTAAAAGYSRAVVTTLFAHRSELLDALTRELQDRFRPPAGDDGGLGRLLAFADAYLRDLGRRPAQTRVFATLWAEALAGEPDLRRAFATRDARFEATLAGYLRDGIADGTIRHDVEPEAMAVTLVAQLRTTGLQSPPDAVRIAGVSLLERGLRAG